MSNVRQIAFASVLMGWGLCAACSHPRAAETVAEAPPVSVAKIVRGDLGQTLTLAAEFRPFQEIEVHAKVAGYVKAINVDVGDRVAAGQLLAVLELPELQDEMAQDEAGVKRSAEEVNRAQADFERAQSAHEVAHLGSTRLDAVMKQRPNLVAQQDIDEALGRDRVAEAQVATAKAAVAAAQEQLAVSKASRDKTKTLFAYARITAPFAGVITHRYADTGAMIQAGTSSQTQAMPIVRLSQNALLRLTIQVPESAVAEIHLGQPVDVKVDALHRTFAGKVARFADKLDPDTRTMETEVDVPNASLTLVPGMYADASITLAHAAGVLIAPVQAIDHSGDKASVVVVDPGGKVELREITIGIEGPDRVEVKSGLQENDLVVVGNRAQLKAGAIVAPQIAALPAAEGAR
ncbi:MAG TPA: efflux RND transporter periplasmic adaptor subunit [Vicinamibacterales bacterium]|jgi:RND family efflux transporter MFP subunit|nr:efflux RND transporter periplasmic adaptor subunit [Vicinamibacterales bacterium]